LTEKYVTTSLRHVQPLPHYDKKLIMYCATALSTEGTADIFVRYSQYGRSAGEETTGFFVCLGPPTCMCLTEQKYSYKHRWVQA